MEQSALTTKFWDAVCINCDQVYSTFAGDKRKAHCPPSYQNNKVTGLQPGYREPSFKVGNVQTLALYPYGPHGFRAMFPYDELTVDAIKLCLGFRWDKSMRAWVADGPEVITDLRRFNIPFAPAVGAVERIAKYDAQMERIIELKRQETGSDAEPYSFQRIGTDTLVTQISGVLADEMGLGKSKQSLDAAAKIEAKDILVIADKTLLYNWAEEAKKWYPEWLTYVVPDAKPKRVEAYKLLTERGRPDTPRVIIVNPEKVTRPDWPERDWDTIIFDEAQRLKNRKTLTHKATRKIAERSLQVVLLTGTPLETSPEEIFAVFSIARPAVFGTGSTRFNSQHVELDVWGKPKSLKNLDLLRERFSPWMTRRTKEQVFKQLPPKIYAPYLFELSDAEAGLYAQIEEEVLQGFEKDGSVREFDEGAAGTAMTRLLRLQQLTSSPYLVGATHLGYGSKYEALRELIDGWDGRVLVFTRFRTMALYLHEWLGLPERATIHGEIKDMEDRYGRIGEFNSGSLGKVFVGTDAMQRGLSVHADLVVHYDMLWNPAREWQREDRCHGINRGMEGRTTTVVHLMAAETIDEGMREVGKLRSGMIHEVIGKADDVLLSGLKLTDFKAITRGAYGR